MASKKKGTQDDKDFLDIGIDDAIADLSDSDSVRASGQNAAPRKNTGVLLYDGRKYAVGLRWLVAEEDADTALATRRAKTFNADFYCFRQNVATQHGFGYLAMGHRVSMPVLAVAVGDMLVGEWHGVFVADNGWWYMAVHADNIAPDGDRFFISEEEAYNHFIAESEKHRWPRTYAPDSWNIQNATGEVALSKIIDEMIGQPPALKPVTLDAVFSGKTNKNMALATGAVVLGLLVFSMLGREFLPSLVPTQAQLPVPNIEVSDDLQAPPKEPTLLDIEQASDLTSFPIVRPSIFVQACLDGFSQTTTPLPGWSIDTVRCKESFVETSWGRKVGTLEMAQPYLANLPRDITRSLSGNNSLLARRAISNKIPREKSGGLLSEDRARALLNKRFGSVGDVSVSLVRPQAAEQLLAGYDSTQEASLNVIGQNKTILTPITPAELPYLDVNIKTEMPPTMLAEHFNMPGVVIQTIDGALLTGTWDYTFKLILKPEARLIEANIKAKAVQIR